MYNTRKVHINIELSCEINKAFYGELGSTKVLINFYELSVGQKNDLVFLLLVNARWHRFMGFSCRQTNNQVFHFK